MPRLLITLTALFMLLHSADGHAGFCSKWEEAKKIGQLDRKNLPEASGVAVSLKFPGRVYWINDSGSKPVLFFSQLDGKNGGKTQLQIKSMRDAESLTITTCGADPCLIVGDTGDNNRRRKSVLLSVFKESDLRAGALTKPLRQLTMKYPDGPHDVEAMAALPNGNLIFISKEVSLSDSVAKVFELDKSEWWDAPTPTSAVVPKEIGTLPVSRLLNEKIFLEVAVTDAAFNSARGVLGVLTYASLIEIPLAKLSALNSPATWVKDVDYSIVPITNLLQQETVTYLPTPDRVLWSSEAETKDPSPIYTLTCADKGN